MADDDEMTIEVSARSEEALVPSFVNESDDEEDEAKEEDYPFLFDVPSANNSPPLSPRQAIPNDENITIAVDNQQAVTNNTMNNSDDIPSSNAVSNSANNGNNTETNNTEKAQQPTTAAPHTLNKRHRVKIHHPSTQSSASWSTWLASKEGQRSLLEIVGVGIIVFVLFRVWWRQRSVAYDSLLLWLEKYSAVQRHAMLLQMSREEVVTSLWKTSSDTLLTLQEHSHHLWQLQKQPSSLKQTVVTAAVTSAAASMASTLASSALSETTPPTVRVDSSVGDKMSSSSVSTPVSSLSTPKEDSSEHLPASSTSFTPATDPQQAEKKGGSQVIVRSAVSPVTWLVSMPVSLMHTLTEMVDYVLRQCIWESLFG